MAEGGMPEAFCSKSRSHMADCEYYAEGGEIPPIPEGFEPETPPIPEGFEPETSSNNAQTPPIPEGFEPEEQVHADNQEKYGGFGQQVLAGLEGAGQGFAGPLATLAEQGLSAAGVPGLTPEDIKGREEANPTTHALTKAAGLGASFLTPIGEGALVAKGANAAVKALGFGAEAGAMSRIGATALKGALEMGMIQGGDEISKAILGQKGGDPAAAVASAMALGGVLGGTFGTTAVGLNKLGESKMAKDGAKFLGDFGEYWNTRNQAPAKDWFITKQGMNPNRMNTQGANFAKSIDRTLDTKVDKIIRKATEGALSAFGASQGGLSGALEGYVGAKIIEPFLSKALKTPLRKGGEYIISGAVKVLGDGDTKALYNVLNYMTQINKGEKAMTSSVDALFKPARQSMMDFSINDKDQEKLEKWIDNGGVNQDLMPKPNPLQAFAEGGNVNEPQIDHIANHFPDQNTIRSAVKGRVSQYLMSLKPNKNAPRLPFDKKPDTRDQEKSYKKALGLATKPLSIMNSIKNGSLSLEELKHFTQMYPEVYGRLGKKMTERMLNAQVDDEKPSYKVRQAMSLFLATPLDSTMTPSSIIAAQATFVKPKAQAQQPQPNAKRGTSTLGKSNKSYQTRSQSAEADRSSRE